MAINPRVTSLTTNAGDIASCLPAGVTCIVGGNNVGKSQLLRDIMQLLDSDQIAPIALKDLTVDRSEATDEEIYAWLEAHTQRQDSPGQPPSYHPPVGGQPLQAQQFINMIRHGGRILQQARFFFAWYADAGGRVGLGGGSLGTPNFNATGHPLATVLRDGDLEQKLSELSSQAFGLPLTLDRYNGNVLLRVGSVQGDIPLITHPTKEISDQVRKLPTLESQGDGVKSFIGLALYVLAGEQPIVLVDEPEAFLHQSQAKALGRWMANQSRDTGRQVIVATHDRNFVLGLLEGDAPVTVLRLSRDGDSTHLHQLMEDRLKEVWADPVMRYSNVLDGLFYSAVCLCEADGDCRFYSAVLDGLGGEDDMPVRPDEILFVPSGGKDRVPKMAEALRDLKVKVYSIVDFDVLNDKALIKSIVNSVGGEWTDAIEANDQKVMDALNADGGHWQEAKHRGLDELTPGPATVAGVELLDDLRAQGVLVVPLGTMEDFDRTIGRKGAKWVNAMLDKGGHLASNEVRQMVGHLK